MGGTAGTSMMYLGTGLQAAAGIAGGLSLLSGANAAASSMAVYNREASMYDRLAEMWSNVDLTPYYEAQAKMFQEQAGLLLAGAREQADAYVANAEAKAMEAEMILKAGEYNATAAEIDALTAKRRTYRQLEQVSDEAAKLLGRQVTLVAKSGVTQTSGSVLDVLMETVATAERSLRDITTEGRLEVAKIRLTGDLARIDALGGAARAKGEAGSAYSQASLALSQGAAGAAQSLFKAKSARLEGFQSVIQGTMRAMEYRARAQMARYRGYTQSLLAANRLRWQAVGSFFGAGSSLMTGLGKIWTK